MSVAEIKQIKLNLIAWIEQLSDTNMISFLDGIRDSKSNADWWENMTESQRKHIDEGLSDVEAGRVTSANDFWNHLKNG